MVKSQSKRKTRSDKFPLTLHPTGQYCKKIRGKLYYFGIDQQKALQHYLEQASYLHSGRATELALSNNNFSLRTLCNLYLDHQESRADIGEIKSLQVHDQTLILRKFVKCVGANRSFSDISTIDLQNYRKKLIKAGKAPRTINNYIGAVKAMYNWAIDNKVIANFLNLKAIKKIPMKKIERSIFTPEQIRKLLEYANDKMKAMILLALNCGFGCTDCAELCWEHLHLQKGRVNFPRTKTGIGRNLPLWKNTIEALEGLPKISKYVFTTSQNNQYVRVVKKEYSGGTAKLVSYNMVSKMFSDLIKKAELKVEKGVGFYTLRRTAATLAARSGDPFAVQRLLGHADLKMASVYVQDVSEQTDRVVNNVRKLIIQDSS